MFQAVVAIIKYKEPLQPLFLLSAVPPHTAQCLHIASVLYRYIAYVMSLSYEIY
jgi:hypothetical protein